MQGSPFSVSVAPDAVSGETCVAYGDGLRYAVAGLQAMFTIEGRDAFQNFCQDQVLLLSVAGEDRFLLLCSPST